MVADKTAWIAEEAGANRKRREDIREDLARFQRELNVLETDAARLREFAAWARVLRELQGCSCYAFSVQFGATIKILNYDGTNTLAVLDGWQPDLVHRAIAALLSAVEKAPAEGASEAADVQPEVRKVAATDNADSPGDR